MTDPPQVPGKGVELGEQDLLVATLVGRYIERREHHETPNTHDLLAAAAEFGVIAVDAVRTLLACYEAMRADSSDAARSSHDR